MRVGIVGYGESAGSFAQAAKAADGVELVFIGGRNPAKAAALADRYGVASGTYEEMLARCDLDCVAISTPPGRHADDAIPFIERGVHTMIEKPMCLTVADCRRIIAAAEKAGVKVMVTQTHRYTRRARRARELIASGALGRVIHVSVESFHDYFTSKRSGWQLDWAMSGGGVTMNPFIHMIDLARYLVGAEVAQIEGKIGFHKPGYDIESNVQAFARFAGGATAFINVDGLGHRNEMRTEVILEGGTVALRRDVPNVVEVYRQNGLWEVLSVGPRAVEKNGIRVHDGYLLHMEEMRDAIEKGGPIVSDGYNGMRNVELCVQILEANGVEIARGRRLR